MIDNNRISFYEIEETTSGFGLKSVCKHLYWVTECDKCREDMKKLIANNGTEFGEIIHSKQKFLKIINNFENIKNSWDYTKI